jgi:group I intron endonuclease
MRVYLCRKIGIYCFENLINNKKYIGQSVHIEARLNAHISMLRGGYDDSLVLQNAWNKYGEDNFKYYILEECFEEELNDKEKYWIKELKTHVSFGGYNISMGGSSGMLGRKHTDESRKKMSEALKGRTISEETKKNMSKSMMGHVASEETKKKMSISLSGENNPNFGHPRSEEVKEKISLAKFGKKMKNSSSIYMGVSFNKANSKWKVEIKYNRKYVFIGYFLNEIDAALAYNAKAIELYGENAKLNIIEEEGNE